MKDPNFNHRSDKFKENHPWFGKDIFAETVRHVFNNDWVRSCDELPSVDGIYEVINFRTSEVVIGFCEYNGYGFIYDSHYVYPTFWRNIEKKEKKYGKVCKM